MSHRNRRGLHAGATSLTLLCLLATATPIFAVSGPRGPMRTVATAGAAGKASEPATVAVEWVLTVSAVDGVRLTKVFRAGDRFFLPLLDDAGGPLADGEYVYELRAGSRVGSAGRFRVADGRLAAHTTVRGLALDFVIPDDLIVQGSACIGLDCVDGESFGFDTIRLKENNLRIHFMDTSAGSFPSNDWGIDVNSSASGGMSFFSIADRTNAKVPFLVEANAATDSIHVDGTGRVGFRTASPVLDLHVNTSNTPAMRLQQNNTAGWLAQTWDIAGNEANFFVRDVTSGSRLPFRIRPGAPTSSLDISAAGNVGIGTASPSAKLHVSQGNARIEGALNVATPSTPAPPAAGEVNLYYVPGDRFRFQFSDGLTPIRIVPGTFAAGTGLELAGILQLRDGGGAATPDPGESYIWFDSDGSLKFRFPTNVTAQLTSAGVWTNASSRAFKNNIRALDTTDAASALRALTPVRYFATGSPDEQVGFIAEDVPDLVATAGREGVAAMDIVAVLTKVVQDQQTKIDGLAAELAALKAALEQVRKNRDK